MDTDGEFLAFVEYVRNEAFQIAMQAKNGHGKKASAAALALCSQAAAKKRQLLGLPEADPEVDYDPDYHWDGTPRQPGEERREKPDIAGGLDLKALRQEFGEDSPPPTG
jgi:hypothetical protein